MSNKQDMLDLIEEYRSRKIGATELKYKFNRLYEVREHCHQVSLECARKASHKEGYEEALDEHNILHGDDAERFLKKMAEVDASNINNQQNKLERKHSED